jgi:Uma2 family endonuclease
VGDLANRERLVARWADLVQDSSLRNLPYKVELNAEGTIEMSPASNRHAAIQAHYAWALRTALPHGTVFTECSILTEIGVRVPDVAWASAAFVAEQRESTPFTRAPEICVEIVSPSNSKKEVDAKVRAYLSAGAVEVWVYSDAGGLAIVSAEGRSARSRFGVKVPVPGNESSG